MSAKDTYIVFENYYDGDLRKDICHKARSTWDRNVEVLFNKNYKISNLDCVLIHTEPKDIEITDPKDLEALIDILKRGEGVP